MATTFLLHLDAVNVTMKTGWAGARSNSWKLWYKMLLLQCSAPYSCSHYLATEAFSVKAFRLLKFRVESLSLWPLQYFKYSWRNFVFYLVVLKFFVTISSAKVFSFVSAWKRPTRSMETSKWLFLVSVHGNQIEMLFLA